VPSYMYLSNGQWTEHRTGAVLGADGFTRTPDGDGPVEAAYQEHIPGMLAIRWLRRPEGPDGRPANSSREYDGAGTQSMLLLAATKESLCERLSLRHDWSIFGGVPPHAAIQMAYECDPHLGDPVVSLRNALERVLALATSEEPSAKDKIARIAAEAIGV
jgi:hypothetical protein